jgi:hypothetical protein
MADATSRSNLSRASGIYRARRCTRAALPPDTDRADIEEHIINIAVLRRSILLMRRWGLTARLTVGSRHRKGSVHSRRRTRKLVQKILRMGTCHEPEELVADFQEAGSDHLTRPRASYALEASGKSRLRRWRRGQVTSLGSQGLCIV